MSLAHKAGSSAVWQLANYAVVAFLNIAFLIVIVRMLPAADFGVFAIIAAVLAIVTQFSEVGLGASLVQRKELNARYVSSVFWVGLGWSLLIFLVIFSIAPLISRGYDGEIPVDMIRLSGISLLCAAVGVVPQSLMIREFDFRRLFGVNVASFFVGHICAGLTLAVLGFGAWSLVAALVVTRFVFAVLAYISCPVAVSGITSKDQFREIFHFGMSLTLARSFNSLAENADKIVLGTIASISTLGLYERLVYLIKTPLVYLGHIMDSPAFAAFSRINENRAESRRLIRAIITICLASSGVVSAYLIIFAAELTNSILGEKWSSLARVMMILGLIVPINLLARVGDVVVRAHNAMYLSVPRKVTYFALVVIGTYEGWRIGELHGVAFFIVAASACHAIMMLRLAARLVGLRFRDFLEALLDAVRLISPLVAKNIALAVLYLVFAPTKSLTGAAAVIVMAVSLDAVLVWWLIRSSPIFLGVRNLSALKFLKRQVFRRESDAPGLRGQ